MASLSRSLHQILVTPVGDRYHIRDEWLRYFLAELELDSGIVAVVAGREQPRWSNAPRYDIPDEFLNTQLVYHLSEENAEVYLQQAGIDIKDAKLRKRIIEFASVAKHPDLQVHPLLLGLCADVVLETSLDIDTASIDFEEVEGVENKTKILVNRLLAYTNRNTRSAVEALSTSRSFNFDLYIHIGTALELAPSQANFDELTEFSFVWKDKQNRQGWYRIHDLVRRFAGKADNESNIKAHKFLEDFYRQQDNIAEAIYHANQQDAVRGVYEWIEVFKKALELRQFNKCRSLMEIRSELLIPSDFYWGRISYKEGDYYANLSLHTEAQQEYLEAIAAYDRVLELAPDDIYALNNKGNTLQSLGDIQASLSQTTAALYSYEQAIAAYNRVLELAPDDIYALNNKGNTLQNLGNLQASLSQTTAALDSYAQSIAAYDRALMPAPNYINALSNKGFALQSLGDIQASLSQTTAALYSYEQAIAALDRALVLAPDNIATLNIKGITLQRLGELQASLSQTTEALNSYQLTISAWSHSLKLSPNPYVQAALDELKKKLLPEE